MGCRAGAAHIKGRAMRKHGFLIVGFVGAIMCGSLIGCNAVKQTLGLGSGQVTAGQLFCAAETAAGPLIVALLDTAGVPVIVTGLASDTVAAWCKQWTAAAVPVSPPTVSVPSVAVVPPPAAAPAAQ